MALSLREFWYLEIIKNETEAIRTLFEEQNKILSDISEALKRNNTLNSIAIEDEYLRNRGDLWQKL